MKDQRDELAERYFAIIQKIIQEDEDTNTRKSTQNKK